MVEEFELKCHQESHDGVRPVLLNEEEDTEMTGDKEVEAVTVVEEGPGR